MSNYNPEIKMYYGPKDTDHQLVPVPDISISTNYDYSNDTVIGYSYTVTLTGSVTALDLRGSNVSLPSNPSYNIGAIADHINKVRKILVQNGNILHVVKTSDNSSVLKAKGGILRSLSFDESPNNWTHFASYIATIEFNSIDFPGNTEDCSNIHIDPSGYPSGSAGIVDISKFKIKSFQDSWNITFDENESFNKVKFNDVGINLNINNHNFNIKYSISATGKHFFDYDNDDTGSSKLLPAWEQAKNFVQYRLHEQVINLINGVLKNDYSTACDSSDNLANISNPGNGSNGLFKDIGDSKYKIYNEKISCEGSESDGSFSATYEAIVFNTSTNTTWSLPGVKHTINKSVGITKNNQSTAINISLNGAIQGYIEGGLIRISEPIELPNQGSFFIYNNGTTTKYNNAKLVLDKIYNSTDYGAGLGENGKRDFKKTFKDALGITTTNLQFVASPNDTVSDPPHPLSFNLTHDYNGGIINYSAEYSNKNVCGKKYQEISIQISNPTKVIAVFNLPDSNNCPLIQELGTTTAKNVSISIKGLDNSTTGQPDLINLDEELTSASPGCYSSGYLPIISPYTNGILTQQQYTKNPIDGSYSLNLNYICSSGCLV